MNTVPENFLHVILPILSKLFEASAVKKGHRSTSEGLLIHRIRPTPFLPLIKPEIHHFSPGVAWPLEGLACLPDNSKHNIHLEHMFRTWQDRVQWNMVDPVVTLELKGVEVALCGHVWVG